MGAEAKPYSRLLRALERRQLTQAEAAARECEVVPLTESLGLLLLMASERDYRYQRAALRWTQRVISEAPKPTLAGISSLSLALADLMGVNADVGRSRLSLALRQVGLEDAAHVVERFD